VPANFSGNPIQFFDDYSWRTFLAMVWPAAEGQRGVADTTKQVGDTSVPLVFETLKSDWEMFQPNGAAPSAWNAFTGSNPCGAQSIGFNDMILASFTKFGNLGEASSQGRQNPLIHALPAQNGTWVRYLTAFNQTEYTQIVNGTLYLLSSLQASAPTFINGALDVKSAWMDMTGLPPSQTSRYYTRQALVLDPTQPTNGCTTITVGLVGLHIVQKTPTRPQWIWTTFEQVDNVPPSSSTTGPFGFNDGKGTASPLNPPQPDPDGGFPPTNWANPVVYNVIRLQPINNTGNGSFASSTQATNQNYQAALKGTVWQFYQLVMTQWPLTPNSPTTPGSPPNTFPGIGAKSSFSNTTLETWDQQSVFTGCMACHNIQQTKAGSPPTGSDFLWSLEINAFQPSSPKNSFLELRARNGIRPTRSKAEQQLMALLSSAAPKKNTGKSKKTTSK
jgi:hypothetical protein